MKTWQKLIRYIFPYWKAFLAGFVCMIIVSLTSLYLPIAFGQGFIDRVLVQEKNIGLLNIIAVGLVGFYFLRGIFVYGQNYLMAYVGQRVVMDLRNAIYDHLQKQSLAFYNKRHTGEMVSRVTYDVGLLQTTLSSGVTDLVQQFLTLAGSFVLIFYLHWSLALVTVIILPLMAYAAGRLGRELRQMTRSLQEKVADLTTALLETLTGIRVVKAFTMEAWEKKRFAGENEKSFDVSMRSVRLSAAMTPIIEFIFFIGVAFILWYGGREVVQGRFTIGEFLAFVGYLAIASTPMTSLSRTYGMIQQALSAADRIFETLEIEPDLQEEPNAVPLPRIEGRVRFDHVSFGYEDERLALSDINFQVEPGEIVALVGPSGAGKSTLVNLLPRFYDPLSGKVEVDGYDVKHVTLSSLRGQVGLVPQESILFKATVRENIAYGRPDAALEEIESAARMANAHEFITALPQGYDTMLGQGGMSISGGQRQRLSIARAILRNPRILILDEATSALDTESERLIQQALDNLMKERTTFIIAHRLSTIQRANRIVVLEGGRIREMGTHNELMKAGGLYKRLYELQFKDEQN